ncbi:MAG: 50S ribosomal protein L9 [Nannocystaceae bacterium]
MAMLKVILTEDIDRLGRAGEIVQVKPGFGRNYLLPRGLALTATRGNLAELAHQRRIIAKRQEALIAEQKKQAAALEGVAVSVPRKKGKDGKLFGSVTSKDIASALAAQNINLDRKLIQLSEPIKAVGTFQVNVRFSADISVELKVNVIGI